MKETVDERLYEFATDRQKEFLDAVKTHGSATAANRALGLSSDVVSRSLRALKARASSLGYAPGFWQGGVPEGYLLGKVTVHTDKHGEVQNLWSRMHPDIEQMIIARDMILDGMAHKLDKAEPVIREKHMLSPDLLHLYTFTDYHYGMYACALQGGSQWDLDLAEKVAMAVMDDQIARAPNAETAIINIQGDFFHQDSLLSVTPTHGHVVDSAARFEEIVDRAIVLIRAMVAKALKKHKHVTLLICEGNHDIITSMMMRKAFRLHYENEPRVTVPDSYLPFYAIEFGVTLLGFHHGHLRKNESLPALFSAQFRTEWGRCPKVYIHTGHRHHRDWKDYPGAEVLQHPTITARDAHAARGGWWSERRMIGITYHRLFGEAQTVTTTPEMLGFH